MVAYSLFIPTIYYLKCFLFDVCKSKSMMSLLNSSRTDAYLRMISLLFHKIILWVPLLSTHVFVMNLITNMHLILSVDIYAILGLILMRYI